MYRLAMYIRLSKEDECEAGESNSVAMQRALLKQYAAETFLNYELQEFCDDGYTGTNFKRPAVQKLLALVKALEIDCILVKDFSRFARDYIELGAYLEQIFPFLGVRFISVNDRYDSDNYQGSSADIQTNFKNLLYDLYSKDLSQKVRASLQVRKENGSYVSGNSPFGYEKAPADRHALRIAADEAQVVRMIFSLAQAGYTTVEIARMLNEDGVKTPIVHKMEKGKTKKVPKSGSFFWNSSMVCHILRNEIYIGNIVQKKYQKEFGGGNHLNPREKWLVTYGHHEPIVDKELFDSVQKRRSGKRSSSGEPAHPLVGRMVCGCCKKNLRYRKGRNPYFTCCERYTNLLLECVDKVNAAQAEAYVLCMLRKRAAAPGEREALCQAALQKKEKELLVLKEKKRLLDNRQHRRKEQRAEAYRKYAAGKSTGFCREDMQQNILEEERLALEKSLYREEEEYRRLQDKAKDGEKDEIFVLSVEMAERYIEKIVVYADKDMEIFWKENGKMDAYKK